MRIIRFFHEFLPEVPDEEITQEQGKSFDKILKEEHARLIRLISDAQENGSTIDQLYLEYNPRMRDYKFPEE